jgi:hypothetical protein
MFGIAKVEAAAPAAIKVCRRVRRERDMDMRHLPWLVYRFDGSTVLVCLDPPIYLLDYMVSIHRCEGLSQDCSLASEVGGLTSNGKGGRNGYCHCWLQFPTDRFVEDDAD